MVIKLKLNYNDVKIINEQRGELSMQKHLLTLLRQEQAQKDTNNENRSI